MWECNGATNTIIILEDRDLPLYSDQLVLSDNNHALQSDYTVHLYSVSTVHTIVCYTCLYRNVRIIHVHDAEIPLGPQSRPTSAPFRLYRVSHIIYGMYNHRYQSSR